jgi:hypothetical protein
MNVQFEAIKVAIKQDATGYVLTLRIHPDEIPEDMLRSFVGAHYRVSMTRLDREPSKSKQTSDLVKVAGILCRDKEFHLFLRTESIDDVYTEDQAIEVLREYLGVKSRTELNTNSDAAKKFIRLHEGFQLWKQTVTKV